MSKTFTLSLADEAATVAAGNRLATLMTEGAVIFLHGDLGAGKTTFTRGVVQGMGHTGKVKSPTYTLVEPYELGGKNVYHFDLYRLADPEELEFMGIRDYFDTQAVCLIEWPSKGLGFIPSPDLDISLEYAGSARTITITSRTLRGEKIVEKLEDDV